MGSKQTKKRHYLNGPLQDYFLSSTTWDDNFTQRNLYFFQLLKRQWCKKMAQLYSTIDVVVVKGETREMKNLFWKNAVSLLSPDCCPLCFLPSCPIHSFIVITFEYTYSILKVQWKPLNVINLRPDFFKYH